MTSRSCWRRRQCPHVPPRRLRGNRSYRTRCAPRSIGRTVLSEETGHFRREVIVSANLARALEKQELVDVLDKPDFAPAAASSHQDSPRCRCVECLRSRGRLLRERRVEAEGLSEQAPNEPYPASPPEQGLVEYGKAELYRWGLEDPHPRLRDLWVCPTCRRLFFADHDRQKFDTAKCREAGRTPRDMAALMRVRHEAERRDLDAQWRKAFPQLEDNPLPPTVRAMRRDLASRYRSKRRPRSNKG